MKTKVQFDLFSTPSPTKDDKPLDSFECEVSGLDEFREQRVAAHAQFAELTAGDNGSYFVRATCDGRPDPSVTLASLAPVVEPKSDAKTEPTPIESLASQDE